MADDGSQFPRIPPRVRNWEELNRRVHDLSVNALARLEAIEGALGLASPADFAWHNQAPNNDWTPRAAGQRVGTSQNGTEGIIVGLHSGDPGDPGIQGAFVERTGAADGAGGCIVLGVKSQDPTRTVPDPGLLASSPVEISGVPTLLMGNVYVEAGGPSTHTFYVLFGPTTTLADGRHVAPLMLGPEYIPSLQDQATDTRDIDLDDSGTDTQVVTLPLTNAYLANVSTFEYEVRLSEEGGRLTDFEVAIFYQALGSGPFVELVREPIALNGTAQNLTFSTPIAQALAATDVIEMRVNSVGTHVQSDGWIRGSIRASRLTVRQG